jgi:hypothetical protein
LEHAPRATSRPYVSLVKQASLARTAPSVPRESFVTEVTMIYLSAILVKPGFTRTHQAQRRASSAFLELHKKKLGSQIALIVEPGGTLESNLH